MSVDGGGKVECDSVRNNIQTGTTQRKFSINHS